MCKLTNKNTCSIYFHNNLYSQMRPVPTCVKHNTPRPLANIHNFSRMDLHYCLGLQHLEELLQLQIKIYSNSNRVLTNSSSIYSIWCCPSNSRCRGMWARVLILRTRGGRRGNARSRMSKISSIRWCWVIRMPGLSDLGKEVLKNHPTKKIILQQLDPN